MTESGVQLLEREEIAETADIVEATQAADHGKGTLKHSLIYALGGIAGRMVSIVMLPIYTHLLTPADYGILELLSMTTDIIAFVTGMGLSWAVTRYYYYYDTQEEKNAVISTAAIVSICLFGAISLGMLPFARGFSNLLFGAEHYAQLVRLGLLSLFLGAFIEMPMVALRARQESFHVVILGLVRLTLGLALNILFLVVLRMGVTGLMVGSVLTAALLGSYLTVQTFRDTGIHFSRPIFRQLLSYGLPLIVLDLGSFVLHFSDRYFLRAFGTLAAVGLYALAYKFAFLIPSFISVPFGNIWVPKALEVHKTDPEAAKPILRSIFSYFNLALVTGSLGIALFAGPVIELVASREFHGAEATVPVLSLAMVFYGYRTISYVGAFAEERSDLIAWGVVAAVLTVVPLNWLLIPRFGAMGAAMSTMAGFAMEFTMVMSRSERVYPLRYPVGRLLSPVIMAVITYLAARAIFTRVDSLAGGIAVRSIALAFYVVALTATGLLRRSDWAVAVGYLRRRVRRVTLRPAVG